MDSQKSILAEPDTPTVSLRPYHKGLSLGAFLQLGAAVLAESVKLSDRRHEELQSVTAISCHCCGLLLSSKRKTSAGFFSTTRNSGDIWPRANGAFHLFVNEPSGFKAPFRSIQDTLAPTQS